MIRLDISLTGVDLVDWFLLGLMGLVFFSPYPARDIGEKTHMATVLEVIRLTRKK